MADSIKKNDELKPCPFCGCPPEIVDGEPYSFWPNEPTKRIRCSNAFGCPAYQINIRFYEDDEQSCFVAYTLWNTRRRKNKLYYERKQKTQTK